MALIFVEERLKNDSKSEWNRKRNRRGRIEGMMSENEVEELMRELKA